MSKIKDSKRAAKMEQIPLKYRAMFQKAFDGSSKVAAISAFCVECNGYSASEAAKCANTICPLFQVSKYTKGARK